ncbi:MULTISPECIES: hypothetical protein [Gordonia]|uniref:hypothetical protein n=1 Tax=Gordonia TaxID=2053 RepID=UPI0023534C03|nr:MULTISPECIES: hypothetical protein [Gordonia]
MTPTDIETHILAELRRRDPDDDGELFRWSTIAARIDGTFWSKQEALTELWRRREIVIVKLAGSPLIGLADEFDRALPPRVIAA